MSSTVASSIHQPPSPNHKRKRSNNFDNSVIDGSLMEQHTNVDPGVSVGSTSSMQPIHAQPVTHHRGDNPSISSIPLQSSLQNSSLNSIGQDGLSVNGNDDSPKPPVGSEEWHRLRRDNHKEVERRRRETINEGITELAKIVPGCEKNKGSILQRAVQYIQQLKENEAANIEKWTLEKLLTEQAISELSASNEKLKVEVDRAWREADAWKKTCASAGIKKKQDE